MNRSGIRLNRKRILFSTDYHGSEFYDLDLT